MELEEYRQPWEVGRHWELKKEFLKFYKDFFPEDKLLCLAQVYSNTELLQCSYPTQVMTQIQKLAKHLKVCKKISENRNSEPSDEPKEKGKRKNVEHEQKSVKLKKPCGSEESEKEETDEFKWESLPPGLDSVDYKSIAQSENFDLVEKLGTEVQKLLKLQTENAFDIILSAALHLNIEDLIDFKYTNFSNTESESERYYCEFCVGATKLAIGGGENRYMAKKQASENALNTLSHLTLIEKLGVEVEKILNATKKVSAYDVLLQAALRLGVEDLIDLKFSIRSVKGTTADYTYKRKHCDIFIGATKMGGSDGLSKNMAKRKASDNTLYILTHLKDLPAGNLESVAVVWQRHPTERDTERVASPPPPSCNKWGRELLEKVAFEIKREQMKLNTALHSLNTSFTRLKRMDDLVFTFYRDLSGDLKDHPSYICDALVDNVPMSQGKGRSRKKAKVSAAENLVKLFLDLFERKKKSSDPSEDIYADVLLLIDKHSQGTPKKLEEVTKNLSTSEQNNSAWIPASKIKTVEKADATGGGNKEVTSTLKTSRNPHSINKRLYDNSIKQNLLFYDTVEAPGSHKKTPLCDISYSVHQCRRVFCSQSTPQIDDTYKCDILVDNKVLGSGIGSSKAAAKNEAARLTLEKMRQELYTVKVNMSDETSFVIKPEELLHLQLDTSEDASKNKTGSKKRRSSSGSGRKQKTGKIICPGNENLARFFKYYANLSRRGVDLSSLQAIIRTLLDGYSKSDAVVPLVFSGDFLAYEKKMIIGMGKKLNLGYNKYQRKDDKNVYIRRKLSVKEFLDFLIKSGGRTQKYELVDLST